MRKHLIFSLLLLGTPLIKSMEEERLLLINEQSSRVRFTSQEGSVLGAIQSQDLALFVNYMTLFTEKFKADLEAITKKADLEAITKDEARSKFSNYDQDISFDAVAQRYAAQIEHRPIAQDHDDSNFSCTYRAPWQINVDGADKLLEQCDLYLKKLRVYCSYADNVARLWSFIRALHLYYIPCIIVIIVLCLAIKPIAEKSLSLFFAKLACVDAIPLYFFIGAYLCWGLIKFVRLKNFWGAEHQNAIDIGLQLSSAQNALATLMGVLRVYRDAQPRERRTYRVRSLGDV